MERDLASTPAPPSAFRTHGALTEVIAEEVLVPRQQWQPLVLRKHPDVLELRERLRGVTGQASFGRFINAARTEVKETLSHHNMLQLLYLFLQEEGMNDTLKSLQQESGVPFCNSEGFPEGAMTGLLRLSVKDPKRLFEDTENEGEDDDAEVVVYDYVPAASFNNEAERDEDKGLESESGLSGLVLDPGTKEVMFGKLNSLIAWLTSASNPDLNFRRIFLLTYQSFTTPETLLHKLIQRYHAVDMLGGEERKQIHQRIFTVTKYWIQQHGADWGEKLISNLNSFIDNILVTDGYTGMAKQLRNALAKMESKPEKQDVSVSYVTIPDPKVPKNIFSPSLTLDDVDEEEIARQLTLIEYEYYSAINSPELLRKRWSDSDSPEWGPNVTALLKRYNDVSRWVSTSILDVPKLKHRAKVLSRFIRIADHLRRQSNFGSLAAVFAGINNSAVHRLRSTRRELPREQQKTLEEMERLMSAENSYANYRAAYRKARPPSIPFAGVHLRDLALVEEAGRMDDEEGKDDVDFVRCKCVWGIIVDVLRFQPVPFNFHHVHQIASFLRTFAAKEISDEEMFLLSFTAEPSVV